MSRKHLRLYAAHGPIPEKTRCARPLHRYSRTRDIVAQGMRVDTATMSRRLVVRKVLAEKITNSESGERPTTSVPKHDAITKVDVGRRLRRDQISKESCRSWPQRT